MPVNKKGIAAVGVAVAATVTMLLTGTFSNENVQPVTHDTTYTKIVDTVKVETKDSVQAVAYVKDSVIVKDTFLFRTGHGRNGRPYVYRIKKQISRDTSFVAYKYSTVSYEVITPIKLPVTVIEKITHDTIYYTVTDTVKTLPKPQLSGNATRQADWLDTVHPNIDYLKAVQAVVIKIDWKDLQNEKGELTPQIPDAYIAWADRMNKTYGLHIRFKLRIVPGVEAPDYVKKAVGTFILTNAGYENVAGLQGRDSNCVKFWKPEFMPYWEDFQKKLAAKYDGNEFIAEIVNSATSTATGESLIRAVANAGGGLTRKNAYIAAGYTIDADYKAVLASIDVMAKYWKRTNCGMAITIWENINTGKVTKDITKSQSIAEYLCKVFGSRAVLGNNGLGTNGWQAGGDDLQLASYFQSLQKTYNNGIYYQTAAPGSMITTMKGVLDLGLQYGCSLVELPQPPDKLLTTISNADLTVYNGKFTANAIVK